MLLFCFGKLSNREPTGGTDKANTGGGEGRSLAVELHMKAHWAGDDRLSTGTAGRPVTRVSQHTALGSGQSCGLGINLLLSYS